MTLPILLLAGCACALLAGSALAQPAEAPAATAKAAGVTMEDLLGAEALGDAWFSPDGRRLLFVRSQAVAKVAERGQDDEGINRDRLMLASTDGGAPQQVGDYAPIHGQPWSPDGGGALMLSVADGAFRLAYRETATGAVRVLPGRPDSSFVTFAWAGSRLAYFVVGEDGVQRGARPQMLAQLGPKWRKAWTGDAPQVTVSSANPLFEPTAPAPGALMLADLKTGQAHKIADGDYGQDALQVSPDGRYLAAVRLAEPLAEAVSWEGRRGELQIFALAPDGARQVHSFPGVDFAEAGLTWSSSGDRLLIGGKAAGLARSKTGVYEIDAASGTARRLAGQDLDFMDPSVMAGSGLLPIGWLGDRPVAIAGRPGAAGPEAPSAGSRLDYGETSGLRFDLYDLSGSTPHSLTSFAKASVRAFLAPKGEDDALVTADGGLWRVTAQGGKRLATAGLGSVLGFDLDHRYPAPPETSAYVRDAHGARVALLTASAAGVQRQVLDLNSGRTLASMAERDFLAASPDLMSAATRSDDGWSASYGLKGPQLDRPLITVNAGLKTRPVAPATRFAYAYHGKQLTGWVLTPPDARPGTPLPAIVSVYGGEVYGGEQPTLSKPTALLPIFSGQVLAAHGYAVIYPSTPLGPGSSTNVMTTLAEECIAAVDALAAKGLVDPARVGVTGQSFGGYSTAAILAARSDRFRAGVAMAGIYDWASSYGVPSMTTMLTDDGREQVVETKMVEDGQIRLGAPFWTSPEAYMRNSPIYHVAEINSPLLFLHGDLDMAITGLPNALRMYNAMVRAGKHPALVRYWGEGHVSASAWAMRDQMQRIFTWFDAYVKSDGPRSALSQ